MDLVLLDPPFQPSEVADEPDPHRRVEVDPFRWARVSRRWLTERGRAVVLVPAWALSRAGKDGYVRESRTELMRTGSIAAVVQLPRRAHTYRTRTELAVLVLQRQPAASLVLCDLERLDTDPREHGRRIAAALRGDRGALDGAVAVLRDVGEHAGPEWPRTLLPSDHIATLRRDVSADEVVQARQRARRPVPPLPRLVETRITDAHPRRHLQRIGGLVQRGMLEIVSGVRVDPRRIHSAKAGVELIGWDELAGRPAAPERRIVLEPRDRLSTRLTRPGDVLVLIDNGLQVFVDDIGGRLAEQPVQVIRIPGHTRSDSWMSPTLLAAILRAVDGELDEYERYRGVDLTEIDLPQLPPSTVSAWTEQIEVLADHRRTLSERLHDVTDLINTLAIGIGGGRLTVGLHDDDDG